MRIYLRIAVLACCWVRLIAQLEEEEEEQTEELAEYRLTFRTSDTKGSGTDANIMLKLTGDMEAIRYPLQYEGQGIAFSDGRIDHQNVTDVVYIGPVCSIEIWNDAQKVEDLWELKTLTILDGKTGDKAIFEISSNVSARHRKYNRTDKADGKWGQWADWSVCEGMCPTGSQNRSRECSHPPPSCGGGLCKGETNVTQECPLPDCKKDETEETTDPSSGTSISIIIPIAIVVFLIVIIIAVVIFKRKKRREETLSKEKKEQNHENVVEYNKMQNKGDNNYVA